MIQIRDVRIDTEVLQYLKKRGLEKQYQKVKIFILAGHHVNTSLKMREPKEDKVWYFRINKQFRALCELEGNILYVLAIDNHQ